MARRWSAVLARLGVPTGDGRILAEGGITSRSLPLPLLFQPATDDGHGGAVVVGRIEEISFGNGMVTARGSMLEDSGWVAMEQIEAGVVGPSVDLDDIEYVMDSEERIVITKGRVAGATLVAIPAFADVSITLDPLPAPPDYTDSSAPMTPEWAAYKNLTESLATFAADTKAAMQRAEVRPPAAWFERPDVNRLTPLTVTDTGRVFGHIAPWDQCHVGLPGCVTPPSSPTGYAYFTTGSQRTAEGADVPVGTLTVGGGHADAQLGFRAAAEHYDNVGAAVAKVMAGEDEHGIWVAGWMLPDADPVRVEQFVSSPVSGDWRRIGGALEMIAVCAVNSPGFPIPRARVAFSNGAQQALVGSFGVQAVRGELTAPAPLVDSADVGRARAAVARAAWNRIGK